MFEFKARDLAAGDRFTFDDGTTWWEVVRTGPSTRQDAHLKFVRVEATNGLETTSWDMPAQAKVVVA